MSITVHEVVTMRRKADESQKMLNKMVSVLQRCKAENDTITKELCMSGPENAIYHLVTASEQLDKYMALLDGIMAGSTIPWPPVCIDKDK